MGMSKLTEICPICGVEAELDHRSWYYTCVGCGSGINLVGIWWKEETGENWLELSQEEKKAAGDRFYERSHARDWSDVVIEI
jgi:hypothetical protein